MIQAYVLAEEKPFAASNALFEDLKSHLQNSETATMEHSALEDLLHKRGIELMRQMLQDHLDLRAVTERDIRESEPVLGNDGLPRPHKRVRRRDLESIFGEVVVSRASYEGPEQASLRPLDAELNLPVEKYSHGARRLVALESAKCSFDDAIESLERMTGAHVPKRQAEQLAVQSSSDFEEFYRGREVLVSNEQQEAGSLLVLSADGKGVPMRRDSLRKATRKAAEQRKKKLEKRQSKGEKRHTKRMATVAAAYTIEPYERTAEDIVREFRSVDDKDIKAKRPRPENKRVWASVRHGPAKVIGDLFAEAKHRDPDYVKRWVALVDGNETQLRLLRKEAKHAEVELTTIIDLIHVLEYLWKAAWAFHKEGSTEAEDWVRERLLKLLHGNSSHVAAGIRRSATLRGLSAKKRKPVDKCADYLIKYRDYLHYDVYLAAGLPIATGVIEGACRHLVKDRMEKTGARWGLDGAEAILRLRALYASGDFDEYWRFHLEQERLQNHTMQYASEPPSTRASLPHNRHERPYLQVVR